MPKKGTPKAQPRQPKQTRKDAEVSTNGCKLVFPHRRKGLLGQLDAIYNLRYLYWCMAIWETPDFELMDEKDKSPFRQIVEGGVLKEYCIDAKRFVLESGLEVPERMIDVFSYCGIVPGKPLAEAERYKLIKIIAAMESIFFRLRAALKREKEKEKSSAVPDLGLSQVQPQRPLLSVDVKRNTVTLEGQTFEISSNQAVRWLKVLSDNEGEFISSAELRQHDSNLDGARPDRLKKYVPEKILEFLTCTAGKGSRLRLS